MVLMVGYVFLAIAIWVITNVITAFGLIGYQFDKWYHWSNLLMFAVCFGQPVIWGYAGIKIFGQKKRPQICGLLIFDG